MKRIIFATLLLFPVEFSFAADKFQYPEAPKTDQADDYSGRKVPDPYRQLEKPDAPESRKWIEAENKLTFDFLKTIPERDSIKARLTALWDYEKFGVPLKEKNRYFISRNSGLQNQNVLSSTANLSEKPKELLDPNTFAKDGTVALSGFSVSAAGKLAA